MKFFKISIFLLFFCSLAFADTRDQIMIVFDSSGSMWGKIEGRPKVSIAKEALSSIVAGLSKDKDLGLIVYGHRRKDDCSDIELLAPVGTLDSHEVELAIEKIKPKGKTPISNSVRKAAEELKYTENRATVVLISDGIETCNADPCKLAEELEKLGVDFTVHVIGFDIRSSEDQERLKCLADNTGGKFILASSAEELNKALEETIKTKPSPSHLKAEIKSPAGAVRATKVKLIVEANPGLNASLYIFKPKSDKAISYVGLSKSKIGSYLPAMLTMPAEVGKYVIKLIDTNNKTLAEVPIEATDADIKMEYLKEAVKGTELNVEIVAPLGLSGYIYLYKAGSDKDINYATVGESLDGKYSNVVIRLPAETGDYQIRWLNSNKELLDQGRLKIVDASISLSHPAKAIKGTEINIAFRAPLGLKGYVYLYKEGSDKHITYATVRDDPSGNYADAKLRLPVALGDFVLKWKSPKNETLAESKLKIVDAQVLINAPREALKSTPITITLEAPAGLTGYVYLYKVGSDKAVTYESVRKGELNPYKPLEIRLPATLGNFILKWQDSKGDILAESKIEIKDVKIDLEVPNEVFKATEIKIQLRAPPELSGYIYLYRKGSDKYITYDRVRNGGLKDYEPVKLLMPVALGDYEIKWQTSNGEVLFTKEVKVIDIEVNMNAPEKVALKSEFEVQLLAPRGIPGRVYLYLEGNERHIDSKSVKEGSTENYEPIKFHAPEALGSYVLQWKPNGTEVLVERRFVVE